ncbi:MAG: hypothetical protein WCJ19_00960 [bacterium]
MFDTILVLFILAFVFNIIPDVAPPTSLLLSFYYIQTDANIIVLTITTVIGAILGRMALYVIVRYLGAKFLADHIHNGYGILRKIVHKNNLITTGVMALYSISPLSTGPVFILAGAAKIKFWPIALGFILGRWIQYFIVALTVSKVYSSLGDIIGQGVFNPVSILLGIIGIICSITLTFLDWECLINNKKIKFHRNIFK